MDVIIIFLTILYKITLSQKFTIV